MAITPTMRAPIINIMLLILLPAIPAGRLLAQDGQDTLAVTQQPGTATAGVPQTATKHTIQFVRGSWAEMLDKGRQAHKLIFVNVFTVWCPPCKDMELGVFTQSKVADPFNTRYINYQIDAEKGEGIELSKKYKVNSFPTYLFIDPDGNLVHKAEGSMTANEFLAQAQKANTRFAKR